MPVPIPAALCQAVENKTLQGASDRAFAGSLYDQACAGRPFTVKQLRAAHRLLVRYEIPDLEEPPELGAAPVVPKPTTLVGLRMAQREVTVNKRPSQWYGIVFSAPYAAKEALHAIPGGRLVKYNAGQGAQWEWRFAPTPSIAATLIETLTGILGSGTVEASKKVAELARQHNSSKDAQLVLDESTPLPEIDLSDSLSWPPGMSARAHQIRSIHFGVNTPASLHALPMGAGKTACAIGMVNYTGAQRIVILCPSKVLGVWPREVRKLSAKTWHIVNGFRPAKQRGRSLVKLGLTERLRQAEENLFDCNCGASVHAVAINYEAFARDPWHSWVPSQKIDMVIYDEIHKIKAPTGTISHSLARWVSYTTRRIGLTGTPMPQTPLDVYGIFRALDPGIFGTSWTAFKALYSEPNPWIPEAPGKLRNIEELARKFYSITYLPTVDLDLPPVSDITRTFELETKPLPGSSPGAPSARQVYDELSKEMFTDLTAYLARGGRVEEIDGADVDEDTVMGEAVVTPANVMVALLRLQQLTGGTLSTTVTDEWGEPAPGPKVRISRGKAELLAETLEEIGCTPEHEGGPEPVVAFCRFRSDLDAVAEVAAAAGLRYAEISGRRSDGLTADSEMTPHADMVGVQIQSGGTGVDLTRAAYAIWYSLGYSMADYDQARKRLDRPGQTRPVTMVHLLAENTADIEVYEALDERRSAVFSVLKAEGIDAAKFGFKETTPEQQRAVDSSKLAVQLPLERLIKEERARLGAPTHY